MYSNHTLAWSRTVPYAGREIGMTPLADQIDSGMMNAPLVEQTRGNSLTPSRM